MFDDCSDEMQSRKEREGEEEEELNGDRSNEAKADSVTCQL